MSNISRRSFLKGAGVAALAVAAAGVLAGCSDKETPDTGAKRDVKLKYLSTSAGKVFGDVVIQVPALATTVSFATIQANKPAAAEGYDFASTAPEMLCHTENTAPGMVASGYWAKWAAARLVARPEFCIPTSMEMARHLVESSFRALPTA